VTKQVALANKTYDRLRRAKAKDESFSAAIERLLEAAPKDPLEAMRRMPKALLEAEAWIRQIEEERESTRQDA
jgi:predicted CopG family antitoxin